MFESGWTWIALALMAGGLFLLPAPRIRFKALLVAAISVGTLLLSGIIDIPHASFLLAITIWIFCGVWLTSRMAVRRPFVAFLVVFLPVFVLWASGKIAAEASPSSVSFLFFVGFSFLMVKAWTVIKDICDGRIAKPDPLVLLAYFLFFPTYICGPMHFYHEFEGTLREVRPPSLEAIVESVYRILLGLVKLKVLVNLLQPVSLEAIKDSGVFTWPGMAIACAAYSVVIWANFSGYSDVAIGVSRLSGLGTPENFNYPYGALNIREFWQRWHISFTRVLTTYLFIPLSRWLSLHLGDKPKGIMALSYLATFLFCGFWHGAAPNMVLWGAYHGVALILYDLYRPWAAKRRLRRKAQKKGAILPKVVTDSLAAAGTFAVVSAGWALFVLPLSFFLKSLR